MLKVFVIFSLLTTISTLALAESQFKCSGSAEYGTVQITDLTINSTEINLTYTVNGNSEVLKKRYFTVEYMQENGSTNAGQKAYFIGGNQTGNNKDYTDDISLPHFGVYKTGLGSEIAFEHDGNRVFGTVKCTELK